MIELRRVVLFLSHFKSEITVMLKYGGDHQTKSLQPYNKIICDQVIITINNIINQKLFMVPDSSS